ncbi:hypothetical protein LIER_21219 [Lithospermum erythrorhizon]|uniref:BED-type domain-containing protein n=1 Tax=Lithospermum erythrorhizon TaxID=34254 RepID=A0AAV3QSX7_LITER
MQSPNNEPLLEGSTSPLYFRTRIDNDAPNVIEKVVDVDKSPDNIGKEEATGGEKEVDIVEFHDATLFQRKTKKKTSAVWAHFTTITLGNGDKKNKCNYCGSLLSYSECGSTSHLKNHNCSKKEQYVKNQQML